jgi:hypothetical protein
MISGDVTIKPMASLPRHPNSREAWHSGQPGRGRHSRIDGLEPALSVDQVGSFRYTTKLSKYLAFGLPVITGQIPLAYDLDDGWIWRLAGDAPWIAGIRLHWLKSWKV